MEAAAAARMLYRLVQPISADLAQAREHVLGCRAKYLAGKPRGSWGCWRIMGSTRK